MLGGDAPGDSIVRSFQDGCAWLSHEARTARRRVVHRRLHEGQARIRQISCVFLDGQYGAKDVYTGVPVKLGAAGVEQILEVPLSSEEQKQFLGSVEAVKGLIATLKAQGHLS